MRPLRLGDDGRSVVILDQTRLPHEEAWRRLATLGEPADAIRRMQVRGAPLIGVTAAYGLCLALRADPSDAGLAGAGATLLETRPTAVNLRAGVARIAAAVRPLSPAERAAAGYAEAARLA